MLTNDRDMRGGLPAIRSARRPDAYTDINRQLGTFYTDTSAEDEERQNEMQARIEELERRLEEEQERKSAQEEQVALLEKSYEIAARYMNAGQTQQPGGHNGSALLRYG